MSVSAEYMLKALNFVLGVLHREQRPELTEELAKLRQRVMASGEAT